MRNIIALLNFSLVAENSVDLDVCVFRILWNILLWKNSDSDKSCNLSLLSLDQLTPQCCPLVFYPAGALMSGLVGLVTHTATQWAIT